MPPERTDLIHALYMAHACLLETENRLKRMEKAHGEVTYVKEHVKKLMDACETVPFP